MLPKHIDHVSNERAALAPYNFVPLPERVVPAELPLPGHNRYDPNLFTGRIACTLTTASPFYVRCGLTLEQFQQGLEAKHLPEFFYLQAKEQPVIPGSSLRGMLRALVEIVSYGKVDRVTDRPRYFYRAVVKDDLLHHSYSHVMGKFGRNVAAGFLECEGDRWYVRPAKPISGRSFIKVKEWDKKSGRQLIPSSLEYKRLDDDDYTPQYVPCSFTTKRDQQGVIEVDRIGPSGSILDGFEGIMITSGNMLETNQKGQRGRLERTSHTIIRKETEDTRIPISPQAVEDYRAGLTEFQKSHPFDKHSGALIADRPIFYCKPSSSEHEITAFGHSPNFRLPYRFPGSERAATPRDFVPEALRREDEIDLAEAIFGTVRRQKQSGNIQAIAGRVFVSDGQLAVGQDDPFLTAEPVTPQVLGSPKPTTFQHYLAQPQAEQAALKHYASAPVTETVIRGHKLYWHKGEAPEFTLSSEQRQKTSDTQLTQIRPVKPGVRFEFTIHFENLRKEELGALLWVLDKAADEQYRLKLGMGKPLGLGAVHIASEVFISDRTARYTSLFADDQWATGESATPMSAEDRQRFLQEFHKYVLERSGEPSGYERIDQTLRIRCLLALLRWPGPSPEATRYLEIERDRNKGYIPAADTRGGKVNEYKNRPVLPTPLQVVGEAPPSTAARPASKLAESQPAKREPSPPARPAGPQIPGVGEVFTGKILELDASAAAIAVPGFSAEQALALMSADVADLRKYKVGNAARVEVMELKTQRSGRVLVIVKPAPKPKKD